MGNSIDQKKEEQPLKLSMNLIIELISNEIEASKNSKAFGKLMLQKHLISNENNWRQFIQIHSMLYEVLEDAYA